jgi:hypothetical protein
MDFMPFCDLSDTELSELFAENYDLAYDEDGEWVFYNGEWLLAGPPIYQDDYEYDQDEPPAPLLQDPLDYPLYDYEDPRDLD